MSIKIPSYQNIIPQNFNDVCGQEIPIKILQSLLSLNENLPPLIFSGIFGTGKTTLAKLFAKAINCETKNICNQCANCQNFSTSSDIQEIDGATNTGIDNIRNIINDMYYEPINLKYKVYIIDEVHMLSKSAFNSLLKTLENPQEYIIFLFATTELEKIPETVISRCLTIQLSPINEETMINYVNTKFKIDPQILDILVNASSGSLRQLLSLIDVVTLGGLDGELTKQYVGFLDGSRIKKILIAILEGSLENAFSIWSESHKKGLSAKLFFQQISKLVHELCLAVNGLSSLHKDIIGKYNISNALLIQWIDIILKQQVLLGNKGYNTVENTIFLMTFIEDNINLTNYAKKAFPDLKITL